MLVALAVIAFGAAAWYFSGEIYEGTLEVEPRSSTSETNSAYFYDDAPAEAFGTPQARDVAYDGELGSYPAVFVPGRRDTWLILVHGRGAALTETFRAGVAAHSEGGFPVLSISYRNDDGAPADASRRYGFGIREWRDLERAVEYALDEGAEDVVLGGFSMGAAIVVHFMEKSSLADRVAGVFMDSPALDLEAAVEEGASHRELPVVGGPLPDVLVSAAEALAELRFDLDWDELDVVEEAADMDVPTLVFHGMADETVPVSVSTELKARDPSVRLERFEGADHVRSWNVDRERYERVLLGFLSARA